MGAARAALDAHRRRALALAGDGAGGKGGGPAGGPGGGPGGTRGGAAAAAAAAAAGGDATPEYLEAEAESARDPRGALAAAFDELERTLNALLASGAGDGDEAADGSGADGSGADGSGSPRARSNVGGV